MSDLIVIQPQVTTLTVTEDVNQVVVSSVGVQGPTGATGAKGDTGDQGPSGVVTVNAPLTNAGTSSAANLSISAGTTSAAGALQLTDSISSTSTTTAATPNAVKTVADEVDTLKMPFISTYYYRGTGINSAGAAAVANRTYYTPFFVPVTTTFDRIAIRTASSFVGTSSSRLGIYNSTNGLPSTVLLDAGTVANTASNQTAEITINQQLTPGTYWLAANTQTAATTNNFIGIASNGAGAYIGQPFNASFATIQYFFESSVTGAFATASSLTAGTLTGGIYAFLRAA